MKRIPEPELMEDPVQAAAYALADFEEPHGMFIKTFRERFPGIDIRGNVLDLGCGPADITIRFARAYPGCHLYAVDGAMAMLNEGKSRVASEGLENRIELIQGVLPQLILPAYEYQAIISNSLLHHLHDPACLWDSVKKYSCRDTVIFIMDLMRPDNATEAGKLVNTYAAQEPDILKRDFYNSLCAAFTPAEVAFQLRTAKLVHLKIEVISDRHLIITSH
jgi:SAM-dependent methyltransferase